jgi:hypothetical protein
MAAIVYGKVTMSNSSPAQSGTVYINGAAPAPVSNGQYSAQVPGGVRTCRAESGGETHGPHNLKVPSAGMLQHNISLQP